MLVMRTRRMMVMDALGMRRIGRVKLTASSTTSEEGLLNEEVQDRVAYWRLLHNIDPHIKMGKDAKEEHLILVPVRP